jgi:phosphatidylinositol alpha-1,6-mannosyltransferase
MGALRILALAPDYPPARGGIQTLVHRLVRNTKGVTWRVVTLAQPHGPEFDRAEDVDVRRVRSGGGPRSLAVLALNARSLLEGFRVRPDAVVNFHIVTSPAAVALSKLLRVRYVQYLYAKEVGGRPRLAAFAVRHAAAVVAISRHTKQLALDVGCEPERLHIITPGVDLPTSVVKRTAARHTLLTVSRLADVHKGHDVLLRALPRILEKVPDAEWVVVGDGPLRQGLEAAAARAGVNEHVRFVGAVSDAERDAWFDSANVFVMPSRVPADSAGGEGFGIVYLEAGAHGLPAVGGNRGGAVDAVVDGETGVLVDANDEDALADAVSRLLLDPERAASLGQAGMARAAEFSWPRIGGRLGALLAGVCGSRGSARAGS